MHTCCYCHQRQVSLLFRFVSSSVNSSQLSAIEAWLQFTECNSLLRWYGPRQSANITTEEHNKDYSKTETLPLSEKEQEIVALMSVTTLNGKTEDNTATCPDEHEKEYLM